MFRWCELCHAEGSAEVDLKSLGNQLLGYLSYLVDVNRLRNCVSAGSVLTRDLNRKVVRRGPGHLRSRSGFACGGQVSKGCPSFAAVDPLCVLISRAVQDPKEYLPFLSWLRTQPEKYFRFVVDNYLNRSQRALEHLFEAIRAEEVVVDDSREDFCQYGCSFDEFLKYTREHRLYKLGRFISLAGVAF